VLAAGQNVQKDVNGKPQSVQDVTLLLSPEQAEKVALATGDGRIQLALRNPMDKEAAEPPMIVRTALYTGPTMEKPPGDSKTKPAPEKVAPPQNPAASKKAAGSPKIAMAEKRPKAPAVAPAPPPPPVRVIVIELIQGSRRAKETFEEKNPEPTEKSTLPDRTPQ
jgi:Flp pilus assembly protein CpaB